MKPHPSKPIIPCRYFGICGGCDFQDIPYQEQLKAKEARIKDIFLPLDVKNIEEIVPSPEIFHYRNKMEYAVSANKDEILIGLRQKKRFYRIVDLEECAIFFDGVSDIFKVFKSWIKKNNIEPYQYSKPLLSALFLERRQSLHGF